MTRNSSAAQSEWTSGNDMLLVLGFLIATCIIAILVTIRKYKKLMSSCDSLIDSLEKI